MHDQKFLFHPPHKSFRSVMPVTVDLVRAEIEQATKAATFLSWDVEYFGNFLAKLPDDNFKLGSMGLEMVAESNRDRPYAEYRSDGARASSQLFKVQTPRQFYATVREVCDSLDKTQMIKMLQTLLRGQRDLDSGLLVREAFSLVVLPVYLQLRELGYKRYPDLTE